MRNIVRYGMVKGSGTRSVCGTKVSLKFLRRGFDRAIRAAPDERVSSPGYLTIVRLRDRSFGKSRIVLAKVSCMTT
jgi:hypothetical protein